MWRDGVLFLSNYRPKVEILHCIYTVNAGKGQPDRTGLDRRGREPTRTWNILKGTNYSATLLPFSRIAFCLISAWPIRIDWPWRLFDSVSPSSTLGVNWIESIVSFCQIHNKIFMHAKILFQYKSSVEAHPKLMGIVIFAETESLVLKPNYIRSKQF